MWVVGMMPSPVRFGGGEREPERRRVEESVRRV